MAETTSWAVMVQVFQTVMTIMTFSMEAQAMTLLYGTAGANMMDGGTGQDNMTGGNGNDTFIIRSGDGGSALTDADIIMDFQDGTDVIGLSGGLSFNDLTIAQGSGSNSSHTIIRITSSGEYLVIVKNISASNISGADFNILN